MYDITFKFLKKPALQIFTLVCVTSLSFSQVGKIDSLSSAIRKVDGIDKFDPLINLVREYAVFDNTEALRLATEANKLATTFGDSIRIVRSSRIMGQLLNRLARPKEAEEISLNVAPLAKRINVRSEYKIILNTLAGAYTIQAQYDKALKINFEALMLREEDKDKAEISISLNNIGVVYFKLRNYQKALEFYSRALQLKNNVNDNYDLDRLLINIGLCYNQLKDYVKAREHFAAGFKVCNSKCSGDIQMEGQFGLGVLEYGLKDFAEAQIHFNESYSIAKEIGNNRFQVENLVYLAKIYIQIFEMEHALDVLLQAEHLAASSGYNELLIDVYRQFAILFNQNKDFERAAEFQSKYITFKDSIYHATLIENIAKVQIDFAERANIQTIADKQVVIERQRSLSIAIAIIAILAGLLIFVLYRSIKVKKKVNNDLSDAKAIIEDQNRQLMSSNYNLDKELKEKNVDLQKANDSLRRVNEELDNFIYKTSHDIRGPLASLKGMCNVALMDVKDDLALNYLKKLDITAEKLNTILTRLLIVNQINNSALASDPIDFDLIISDVLLLEKKKGMPQRLIINQSIDEKIVFHSDREFVRIIMENLIDNAIKFYNDSDRMQPFVNIAVRSNGQYLSIHVVDNGIGISEVHPDKIFQMFSRASERSETGGIGLYITKTATEKLGGTVHLKTTPEGYTEFYVRLPYNPSQVLV